MSAHSAAHDHGHDAGSHASSHAPQGAEASDHDPWADDDSHDHDDGHHAEPPPPEPESPSWLPILGAALFLLALLGFLLTQQEEPSTSAEQGASAEADKPREAPPPSGAPKSPAPFGTGRLRPLLQRGSGERAPSANP